ncbi:unnamed protein product, partial [Mesorhabditis spiculigera]
MMTNFQDICPNYKPNPFKKESSNIMLGFRLTPLQARHYRYSVWASDWYQVYHKLFGHVAIVDLEVLTATAPNEDLWLRLLRTPSHLTLSGPYDAVEAEYHKSLAFPHVADKVTCKIEDGLTPNIRAEDLIEKLLARHRYVHLELTQREQNHLLHVHGSSERILRFLLYQLRKGFTTTKCIFYLKFSGFGADFTPQQVEQGCGLRLTCRPEFISVSSFCVGVDLFCLLFWLDDYRDRQPRHYRYSVWASNWYQVYQKLFGHVAIVDLEVRTATAPNEDLWLRLLRTPSHLQLLGPFSEVAEAYHKSMEVPEVANRVTCEIDHGLTPNMPVENLMEKLLWRHNFVHLKLKQTEPADLLHVRGSSERIIRCLLSQHRKGFASTKRIFHLEFSGLHGLFQDDAKQVYTPELFAPQLKMLLKPADVKNTLMYAGSTLGNGNLFWCGRHEAISASFYTAGKRFQLGFCLADFHLTRKPRNYMYSAYTSDWYLVFHKLFAHVATVDIEVSATSGPADDLWLRLLRTPSHLKLSGSVMPPRRAFGQIAAAYYKTLQVPEVANKLLWRHNFVHLKLKQTEPEDLVHVRGSSERIIRCLLSQKPADDLWLRLLRTPSHLKLSGSVMPPRRAFGQIAAAYYKTLQVPEVANKRRKGFASTKLIFYLEFCGLVGRFPREEARLKVPIISSHGIGGRHYTLHAYTHDWYRIFHKLFAHVSTFDIRVYMYKASSQDLWLRLLRAPSHLTLSGPYDAVEAEYHKSLAFPNVADKVTCKIEDGLTPNIRAEDLIEKLQARHRFVHLELIQREQEDLLHVHGSSERILRFLLSQHRKGFTTTKRIFYLEFSGLGAGFTRQQAEQVRAISSGK